MDMLGWCARMAGRMTPAGLFLVGGAAALAFPSVRHGLRGGGCDGLTARPSLEEY